MSFGLDKHKKLTIKRGKISISDNVTLTNNEVIQEFDNTTTYKYPECIKIMSSKQHQDETVVEDF